jgi:hypothetical protein
VLPTICPIWCIVALTTVYCYAMAVDFCDKEAHTLFKQMRVRSMPRERCTWVMPYAQRKRRGA